MISKIEVKSFTLLLREWQSMQSLILNVIVLAAKFSITRKKKDELLLKQGLEESVNIALRDLSTKIARINYKFSTDEVFEQNVEKLNKIQILEFIYKCHKLIEDEIKSNDFGDLYKSFCLSSEYVSLGFKGQLNRECTQGVEKIYAENSSLKDL